MSYKQSMFNYIHSVKKSELLLYNSYVGFNSLASISTNEFNEICSSLKDENVGENLKFQKLRSLGYFVSEDTNELLLREQRYMEIVGENVLRLIILPTEQCNFCCRYCYETFEKGKMSCVTQDNLISYVRKNIMKYAAMEVRWFGGEPLMAMDVIKNLSEAFLQICRAAKRSYSAAITTNGYDLSLENFKKLYNWKIYYYQITIDGIKETHDNQRMLKNGKGTFERIVSNLMGIKQNIKSGVPRFTIRTNFTKDAAQHIDEYLDFFSSRFSDDRRFSFSIQRAADWGGERVQTFCDNVIDYDFYSNLLKKIAQSKYKLDISPHGSLMSGDTCVCYANKRYSFVIGSDGIIYKCTGDFVFPQNKIGYLAEGEMLIDENLHAKWICSHGKNFKPCNDCFYSGACLTGSCPASFVKNEKDDICLFEKKFIDEFLELYDRRYFTRI